MFSGKIRAEPEAHAKLAEALDWFSDMVEATGYAAGTDHLTLADLRSEIWQLIKLVEIPLVRRMLREGEPKSRQ